MYICSVRLREAGACCATCAMPLFCVLGRLFLHEPQQQLGTSLCDVFFGNPEIQICLDSVACNLGTSHSGRAVAALLDKSVTRTSLEERRYEVQKLQVICEVGAVL